MSDLVSIDDVLNEAYKQNAASFDLVKGILSEVYHYKEPSVKQQREHDKEIRNKAIEDFSEKIKEKCDSMISTEWNSETAPISWADAYEDFKDDIDEIAEQMKEVE